MREISTEPIKIGEHILVDGVEYVAEEYDGCSECAFNNSMKCSFVSCCAGKSLGFKEVKKGHYRGK